MRVYSVAGTTRKGRDVSGGTFRGSQARKEAIKSAKDFLEFHDLRSVEVWEEGDDGEWECVWFHGEEY